MKPSRTGRMAGAVVAFVIALGILFWLIKLGFDPEDASRGVKLVGIALFVLAALILWRKDR